MNAATIRLSRLAALAVSALMLTGCATMSVGSYLARGLDLHAYHTFDWGSGRPLHGRSAARQQPLLR